MIDNQEMEQILAKLEQIKDEELAANLLKEFNDSTKRLGKFFLNLDEKLSNDEWKIECDQAKQLVDDIIKKINSL